MSVIQKVQVFGRKMSAMIMPNIGAFIAWGLVTALFIPTGWIPNENLVKLVDPMIKFMLPLLIGYTAGSNIHGVRGGVMGAIATMGAIVGSEVPMFIGAMIMGPIGATLIKWFDTHIGNKTKAGFEMLVNNFSVGILGMLVCLVAFLIVGGLVESLTTALGNGVKFMVDNKILPLVSILVEPAKILFMNNAINHGVFTPLGTNQVIESGKSMFFLIEANPGPGLGVLLAFMFLGKGNAKSSASGSAIIHFFGGIHEVYFPYILAKPTLIISLIAGGIVSVTTLSITGAGLVSPASPGSILAISAVAAKGSLLSIYLAVILSTIASFAVSSFLLALDKEEADLDSSKDQMANLKQASHGLTDATNLKPISLTNMTIVVACDAGMGSSAMGATMLRKVLEEAGIKGVKVYNSAINDLKGDETMVITHQSLLSLAEKKVPSVKIIGLNNFMDKEFYKNLATDLKK